VKCGEEKPACTRCVSTGRKCDGYGASPLKPEVAMADTVAAKEMLEEACSKDPALARLRPLIADINGSERERLYFHRFREAAEDGMCSHVFNTGSFWSKVIPSLSHRNEAVRHAVIALGAAYQMFQTSPPHTAGTGDAAARSELEMFTLRQYSKSMAKLHAPEKRYPITEKIGVTLFCCSAFVCIESLRYNYRPALTHLTNGLRIIESLPFQLLQFLKDPKGMFVGPDNRGTCRDMDYVLRLFSTWELSGGLFAENFKPVISLKLYESHKLEEMALREFDNLRESHIAVVQFCRDTFAFAWETKDHRGDAEFWSQPVVRLQQGILQRRAVRIAGLLEKFSAHPASPKSGREYYSMHLDQVHFKSCSLICDSLSHRKGDTTRLAENNERFEDIIAHAAVFREGFDLGGDWRRHRFTLDIGIVAPLYFVASNCRDPGIQTKAVKMMKDWRRRENLWDAVAVSQLLKTARNLDDCAEHPMADIPESLSFGHGIPALYDKFAELRITLDED
jgi:hypothetical protein